MEGRQADQIEFATGVEVGEPSKWRHKTNSTSQFNRVAVFCGASSGTSPIYMEAAQALGEELGRRGIGLVYGGGSSGLMGKISETVHKLLGEGSVIGVMPAELEPREVSGEAVGEVRIVRNMHERKAVMAREASAFICLPVCLAPVTPASVRLLTERSRPIYADLYVGAACHLEKLRPALYVLVDMAAGRGKSEAIRVDGGYGTLEEGIEILTWAQLGFHKKPVALLNINGFYDQLLGFFDHCVTQGFVRDTSRKILLSDSTPTGVLEKLEAYQAGPSILELASQGKLLPNQRG